MAPGTGASGMRSPMKNSVFRRCGSSRSARATLVMACAWHVPQLQSPTSWPSARIWVPKAEVSMARFSRALSAVKFCGTP